MRLSTLLLALVLAGCTKPIDVPAEWATTVTKPTDPVDPSCNTKHELTEPQGASGSALVKFGNAVVDDYAKLKADAEKCAAWARGQRK